MIPSARLRMLFIAPTHVIWLVAFNSPVTPSEAFNCSIISSRRFCACSFKSARYVHSSPVKQRSSKLNKYISDEKSDTWLLKPSIANFSCRTLYGSYPMSVMFSCCLIGSCRQASPFVIRWETSYLFDVIQRNIRVRLHD